MKLVRNKFDLACEALGLNDLNKREIVFSSLMDYYESTKRLYHDFSHLASMFSELDDYLVSNTTIDNLNLNHLVMAILYHDAFIDILMKNGTNEEISTIVADKHLSFLGLDNESVKKISQFIMGTFARSPVDYISYKLICDLDYSILGQEPNVFDEYEKGIKYEYVAWGGFSEDEYRKGRREFLESILSLPRIYFTDYFFNEYEETARENIKRLLEKL